MFRERSDLDMDIRRSLNLLRGDFGTRRIGTINFFKGIYTTGSKPLRAYLQDAICRGLSYGSISGIRLIMVCIKVVKVCVSLLGYIYILQPLEYMDSVFKPTLLDNLSKRTKFLEYMDSVFVYKTFIWGQNKGSKRGILVE
ncbi:unnamed protein product [Brassica oleracea var. botrytis]